MIHTSIGALLITEQQFSIHRVRYQGQSTKISGMRQTHPRIKKYGAQLVFRGARIAPEIDERHCWLPEISFTGGSIKRVPDGPIARATSAGYGARKRLEGYLGMQVSQRCDDIPKLTSHNASYVTFAATVAQVHLSS